MQSMNQRWLAVAALLIVSCILQLIAPSDSVCSVTQMSHGHSNMQVGDQFNHRGTIMSAPLMGVEEIRRRQTMSAQDQAAEAEREESMKQGSDKLLFAQNDANQLNELCETFESDFVADQGIDLIGRVRTQDEGSGASYDADLRAVVSRHVKNAVIAFVAKMNIDNTAEFSEKNIDLLAMTEEVGADILDGTDSSDKINTAVLALLDQLNIDATADLRQSIEAIKTKACDIASQLSEIDISKLTTAGTIVEADVSAKKETANLEAYKDQLEKLGSYADTYTKLQSKLKSLVAYQSKQDADELDQWTNNTEGKLAETMNADAHRTVLQKEIEQTNTAIGNMLKQILKCNNEQLNIKVASASAARPKSVSEQFKAIIDLKITGEASSMKAVKLMEIVNKALSDQHNDYWYLMPMIARMINRSRSKNMWEPPTNESCQPGVKSDIPEASKPIWLSQNENLYKELLSVPELRESILKVERTNRHTDGRYVSLSRGAQGDGLSILNCWIHMNETEGIATREAVSHALRLGYTLFQDESKFSLQDAIEQLRSMCSKAVKFNLNVSYFETVVRTCQHLMSTRPALAVHILHYEQNDPDAAIENDAALAYDDFLGHVKHLVDQHRECAECKHPIRPLDSVYVAEASCQSFMDKAWQLTDDIIVDTAAPVASRMGNQAGKGQCRLWNSTGSCKFGAACRYSHGANQPNQQAQPHAKKDFTKCQIASCGNTLDKDRQDLMKTMIKKAIDYNASVKPGDGRSKRFVHTTCESCWTKYIASGVDQKTHDGNTIRFSVFKKNKEKGQRSRSRATANAAQSTPEPEPEPEPMPAAALAPAPVPAPAPAPAPTPPSPPAPVASIEVDDLREQVAQMQSQMQMYLQGKGKGAPPPPQAQSGWTTSPATAMIRRGRGHNESQGMYGQDQRW